MQFVSAGFSLENLVCLIIIMPVQEPEEEIYAWRYVKLDHFVV